MTDALQNFLKNINKVLNKEDIESEMSANISEVATISDFYLDIAKSVETKDFNSSTLQGIYRDFYSYVNRSRLDVKLSYREDFLSDVGTLLGNASENAKVISAAFNSMKNKIISTGVISSNRANLLRSVPHYFFLSSYAARLLNYILKTGIQSLTKQSDNSDRLELKFLSDNIGVFAKMLAVYGCTTKEFSSRIDTLSVAEISAEENERLEAYHAEGNPELVPGLPHGFYGSPAMFFGTIYNSWFDARYKLHRDQKNLLELRLNYYMTLRSQGNQSKQIEDDIIDLQSRINVLQNKIQKMEDSVK